jgi:hypothetical protein
MFLTKTLLVAGAIAAGLLASPPTIAQQDRIPEPSPASYQPRLGAPSVEPCASARSFKNVRSSAIPKGMRPCGM